MHGEDREDVDETFPEVFGFRGHVLVVAGYIYIYVLYMYVYLLYGYTLHIYTHIYIVNHNYIYIMLYICEGKERLKDHMCLI